VHGFLVQVIGREAYSRRIPPRKARGKSVNMADLHCFDIVLLDLVALLSTSYQRGCQPINGNTLWGRFVL